MSSLELMQIEFTRGASQIASLKDQGLEIVLVSSGSIVEGMKRLGWKERPHEVHLLQVAGCGRTDGSGSYLRDCI